MSPKSWKTNQQRNQIIEQAQLLNVLKKHFVNECYYSTKEAKRLENQMMKKQWSLMFMDDFNHPQPTSPSIHQEKHWLLSFNYYYTQFPRALAKSTLDNIIIAAKIHNSMHSTNNPIRKKTLWLKANETQITWLQNVEEKHFFWKNTAATQQSPKSRPRSQKRKPPPPISNPHHSEHHVIKKRSKEPLSVIELKNLLLHTTV